MFKVINAEIKKMLSKPGIYILAVVLAVILILGAFIYKPTVYEDTTIILNGQDFTTKYNSFTNGIKVDVDSSIEETVSKISSYSIVENDKTLTYKDKIASIKKDLEDHLKDYASSQQKELPENKIIRYQNNVVNTLTNLKDTVINGVDNIKKGIYTILTSEENFDLFTETINDAIAQMKTDAYKEANGVAKICHEYDTNYRDTIESSLNALIYPSLSDELLSKYYLDEENSRINTVKQRLTAVSDKIIALHEEANTTEGNYNQNFINQLETFANQYVNIASDYSNLVSYELLSNAFSFVSTADELKLYYLKNQNYTEYNSNSNLIKYNFLFEQNKTDADYAHPLTIGVTSNHTINAYDYAYFSLKLFSFVIVVYAVMAACNAIAGEIKEGSMRYYAIRPVTRKNIYFGKLLAIIIMSIIFIIFSTIIALAVGGAV